jgi:hypothetical protein
MPLNCDEGIQLLPSNSFSWEKNLTIIYGENIAENRVYIFDSSGKVIRKLENVELFTFIGDVYPIFIRETKILSINLDTGQEDLIFEFDKTKYTFHSPNDPDGEGLPEKFDYYWGGIRGEIFSTNYEIEDGYTFVIDAMKKELIFWLQGHYTDLKNVQPPDKGLIKNSN